MDGKYRRAEQNGYVGGIVPFGYRVAGDRRRHLEIDDQEAEIIRRIYHWLIDERMSCITIAQHLNALGVPTACGNSQPGRHRAAKTVPTGRWYPSNVAQLVRRPLNKGVAAFGKNNPSRAQVYHQVPAIVDEATWDAAQRRLDQNRNDSKRNAKRLYLLRGLIRCVACQKSLHGKTQTRGGKDYAYYVCRGQQAPPVGTGTCPLPAIRAAELEADLWEKLIATIRDRDGTAQKLQTAYSTRQQRLHGLQAAIDGLRGAISKKQTAETRDITLATDGLITREQLEQRITRLRDETEALRSELARREREVEQLTNHGQRIQAAREWLAKWSHVISDSATAEEKRAAVEHFVIRVDIRVIDNVVRPQYLLCFDPGEVENSRWPMTKKWRGLQ